MATDEGEQLALPFAPVEAEPMRRRRTAYCAKCGRSCGVDSRGCPRPHRAIWCGLRCGGAFVFGPELPDGVHGLTSCPICGEFPDA
jgi:hypothetical protein